MTAADKRKWDRIKDLWASGASEKRMSTGTGLKRHTVIRLIGLKRLENKSA